MSTPARSCVILKTRCLLQIAPNDSALGIALKDGTSIASEHQKAPALPQSSAYPQGETKKDKNHRMGCFGRDL